MTAKDTLELYKSGKAYEEIMFFVTDIIVLYLTLLTMRFIVLDLIRDYASVFGKGSNYHYYIFSKGGFTDGLIQAQKRGEVQLITLKDLYK